MQRRRHTPDQVVRKLREADRMLAEGKELPEVAKALEISEATYHRWRTQFGGIKADDARRLKDLERENTRLKRMVADRELEIDMLKEIARGKLLTPNRRRQAVSHLTGRFGVSERFACKVGGQHRSTSVTADGRPWLRRMPSVPGCGRSPGIDRAGDGVERMSCCATKALPSTASEPSGCGATRACGCLSVAASAGVSGTPPSLPAGWPPPIPTTCGPSITSSIRPPTGGQSSA